MRAGPSSGEVAVIRRVFALSIVVLLALISPALADKDKNDQDQGNDKQGEKSHGKQGGSEDQAERFKGLDKNHDGRISRDEWHGNDKSFSNHDKNHDGFITADEYESSDH